MSSPIHRYLFSPPTSPRLLPSALIASPDPNLLFTPLRALLPPAMGRASDSDAKLAPGTPTPAAGAGFTLDGAGAFTSPAYPSRSALPVDATPAPTPTITTSGATPKHGAGAGKSEPVPVPTATAAAVAIPHTLPKPVLRLILLVALIFSSAALLTCVPGARLPSLRAAAMSRRVALDPTGRAALAVDDRDYVPPQVRSRRIARRRVEIDENAERAVVERAHIPGPAQLFGQKHPRPLPPSHELMALQSFILGSEYNVLPASTDGTSPLDAHVVLGHTPRLGPAGSPAEQAWLDDIAAEHADDVTVWYGADGSSAVPAFVLDLLAELTDRAPTLVPCHARPDVAALRAVFNRLSIDFSTSPVLFVGNEAISADRETLLELVKSGELHRMLHRAGWARTKPRRERRELKHATPRRHELSEVEDALA
ncbi:hypothetical protein Q5752_001565 [Cryptotrichosporon argae]